MTVLVIGDANVDVELRLPAASGDRQEDAVLFGGGSAANTAVALARLGVPVRFVGTVGDDIFGREATQALVGEGVACTIRRVDVPTVAVMAVVTPEGERLIYVWPPTGGAHLDLQPADLDGAFDGVGWLHVSGIALRGEPASRTMLEAMDVAHHKGVPVSLDLNLRLENWGWSKGFREVILAAVERSDFVTGSGPDEVAPLAGMTDPVAAARALATQRRTVVSRLGSRGSFAAGPEGEVTVPALPVEVVDTLGAGDAFDAGFIAARLGGADLAESLRYATAVAALTIGARGARSSPTREAVEALLDRGP